VSDEYAPSVPRSIWPRLSALLIAVKPRSCICTYELNQDGTGYALKWRATYCPWHTRGTR
jgi:hypothetical protein